MCPLQRKPRECKHTFCRAVSLAWGSFLTGICADMPPMAKMPRRWHVLISSRLYARMQGCSIVTTPLCAPCTSQRQERRPLYFTNVRCEEQAY